MPLSDLACRSAKCSAGRTYQRLTDSGGLYLEVSRTGAKLWRWKYRFTGKEKRLAIGKYPGLSLAGARKERDAARDLLKSGSDPSSAKREARRTLMLESETAFEKVARRWFADWKVNKAERHADYTLRRLEAEVFPVIGARNVRDLDTPERYTIAGRGKGGTAGFAKGGAKIRLVEDRGATVMHYEVEASVGGKLAQLGGRLIDSTAKKLAGQFFEAFEEIVGEAPATVEPPLAVAAVQPPERRVSPLIRATCA